MGENTDTIFQTKNAYEKNRKSENKQKNPHPINLGWTNQALEIKGEKKPSALLSIIKHITVLLLCLDVTST